jgi:hypothetical protein
MAPPPVNDEPDAARTPVGFRHELHDSLYSWGDALFEL